MMESKKIEKIEKKTSMVKMKIDQNSPDFGDRVKDEEFPMNTDLAKLHEERGILKIIKGAKNVNE